MAESIFFDRVIKPHRAMKPVHIKWFILGLSLLFFLGSLRFMVLGAWPVAIFMIIDLAALALAFYVNVRRSRIREHIYLSEKTLEVSRWSASGHIERWEFEPYWVKLEYEGKQKGRTPACRISLHEKGVSVGSFLGEYRCKTLYREMKGALSRWKER